MNVHIHAHTHVCTHACTQKYKSWNSSWGSEQKWNHHRKKKKKDYHGNSTEKIQTLKLANGRRKNEGIDPN